MKAEFVSFLSTDKLELPGLLYAPPKSSKVAIYLHGNGDAGVFYQHALHNAFSEELGKKGIAYFAFNNRGARYKKNLKIMDGTKPAGQEERFPGGAHYELIEECVRDIDGATKFLKTRGFKEFYLVGFSTGANKICVYDHLAKDNEITKYVHAGPGDDSGLFYNEIGASKYNLSLKYAKRMLKAGELLKVMPKFTGMHPFSVQAAADILHPDGPYNTFPYFEATTKRLGKKELFKEYKGITKPQLIIFGEYDEFTYTGGGTAEVLKLLESVTNKKSKAVFDMIPGTDHGFHGRETELARRVAGWLA